jgi:hypothetical protein
MSLTSEREYMMFVSQADQNKVATYIAGLRSFGPAMEEVLRYALKNAYLTRKRADYAKEAHMLFDACVPAIEQYADKHSRNVIFGAGGINHLSVSRNVALNGETSSRNLYLRGKSFEASIITVIHYKLGPLGWKVEVQVPGTNDNLRGTTDLVVTNPNDVAFLLHCKTATEGFWKGDILTNKGYSSYMVTLGERRSDLSKAKVEDMHKNGVRPVIVSTKRYKSGNGIITFDELVEKMGGGETAPKSATA